MAAVCFPPARSMTPQADTLETLPSGVPGLDEVLGGGFTPQQL